MIRLQGGSYSNEGRVEVYCNGQWGTICDDGFSSTEAKLICKQLGYTDFVDYNHLNRSAYTIIITVFAFLDLVVVHNQYGWMSFIAIAIILTVSIHVNNVLVSSYMIVFTMKMSLLNAVSLLYQYK